MSPMEVSPEVTSSSEPSESERIYQLLRGAFDTEARRLAELLASKPNRELLGQTEYEVRDRVHSLGALALETALNERSKKGVRGS